MVERALLGRGTVVRSLVLLGSFADAARCCLAWWGLYAACVGGSWMEPTGPCRRSFETRCSGLPPQHRGSIGSRLEVKDASRCMCWKVRSHYV